MRHAFVAALGLAGCSVYSCPPVPPPPEFLLRMEMPQDFAIQLRTFDRDTQLDVALRADGRARWSASVPATTREIARGEYHADDEQVAVVWASLVDANFDRIAYDKVGEGEVAPDVRADIAWRIERFAVRASGAHRAVSRSPGAADVAGVRSALLATLPAEARTALGR